MIRFLSITFWLMILLAAPAHAWGPTGHHMIAQLAEAQLSPKARNELRRLIALEPGATLADASVWPDMNRTPETRAWHYVNFQRDGACRYDAQRECPNGNCVVDAIATQAEVLKSAAAGDEKRLLALKYVIHFIEDVHQPLHGGYGDDRGGNTYQVQAFEAGSNLHALWDSGMIENRRSGPEGLRAELADALRSASPRKEPLAPIQWAEESCRIVAAEGFYPDGHKIDAEYVRKHDAILKARMLAAVQRLASVLEDALGNAKP